MKIFASKLIFIFLLLLAPLAKAQKTAVFVIGTGRCGSSCTAGLLKILGLPLGDDLRKGIALKTGETIVYNNPKGFFEDISTVELTKNLLTELNAKFIQPVYINWKNHSKREDFTQRIKKSLQDNFGSYDFFGIKNPIIGLFLPLYCQAAQELGYEPKVIVVHRNLDEVYLSWKKNFARLTREQIISALSCYTKAITTYTPDYPTVTIDFDDVVHNTKQVVATLNNFLPQLRTYDQVAPAIEKFIEKNLKHHNSKPTLLR